MDMEGSKKMAVAGVLVITMMVLIAAASAVQDVITRDAYLNLLKKKPGLVVTKDVISNPLLEEAFLIYADRKLGGSVFNCGESCLGGTCNTPGCTCSSFPLCTKNSLDEAN